MLLPASEERQVHNRGKCICKLQYECLEDQPLLKTFVRFWHLLRVENNRTYCNYSFLQYS